MSTQDVNPGAASQQTAQKSDVRTERRKRLRQRNWALAAALVLFVVLVYIVSIVKMGGA